MTAMTFDTPLRPSSPRPARATGSAASPVGSRRFVSPVRLTRRGRALLVLLLVSVVLVAFSLGRTSADAGSATPPMPTRTTIVQPGETLWSIARRVAPGADPRQTITRLTDLNGLGSAPIVAGQRLVLPR